MLEGYEALLLRKIKMELSVMVIALVLAKYWPLNLSTAYFATSPGGMSDLVPMEVDMKVDPTLIASFHFFRIFLVLLTAPAIFKIILDSQGEVSGL